MTNDARLFPAVARGVILLQRDSNVGNKNRDRSALRFKIIGECLDRSKICLVQGLHLCAHKSGLIFYRWNDIRQPEGLEESIIKCVPSAASLPLVTLLQAKINLEGFIEAKCLAACKPTPELAPVTSTVFPERSAVWSGGVPFLWCTKNFQKDGLAIFSTVQKGRELRLRWAPFYIGGWGGSRYGSTRVSRLRASGFDLK